MEILFAVFAIVSFVACVYAYLTGVKHGMRVSARSVPNPIKEAVVASSNKKEPTADINDVINQIMSYDYDPALKATDQMRFRGEICRIF